jgi:hypothetical protein
MIKKSIEQIIHPRLEPWDSWLDFEISFLYNGRQECIRPPREPFNSS